MYKLICAALVLFLAACNQNQPEQGAPRIPAETFSTYAITNENSMICYSISSKLDPYVIDRELAMRFDDLNDFTKPSNELRFGMHIATLGLHLNETQKKQAISRLSTSGKPFVKEDQEFIYIVPTKNTIKGSGFVFEKNSLLSFRVLSSTQTNNGDSLQEEFRAAMLAIDKMQVACPDRPPNNSFKPNPHQGGA